MNNNLEERELYSQVIDWFNKLLKSRFKRSKVFVFDTSRVQLYKFLENKGYEKFFKDYLTYDIRVDITGIIIRKNTASLSFIECKTKPISLKDISQLLGYSKVASPWTSIIISPKGISKSVSYLLKLYQRYDILKYNNEKKIRIATWDLSRKEIDLRSVLPPGEHF